VLASNHKDWRAPNESLEHADCRSVAHWSSTDRSIDTGSTETGCTSELSYRPAACHHGSAQRTSIKSSRGRIPERHRRLSRRHVLSMPGFCSQTAYIFRAPNVASASDAIGSAWCVDHAVMRPCCCRVCALYHVASVASLASSAGFTIEGDIANQTHRAHAAWLATFAQSASRADQVDNARLALRAEDARSAEFASSANPTAGRLARAAGGCRAPEAAARRWSAASDASVAARSPAPSPRSPSPTDHLLSPSTDARLLSASVLTSTIASRTRIADPDTHTVASVIPSRSNVPVQVHLTLDKGGPPHA
jgi:hypothetical protein